VTRARLPEGLRHQCGGYVSSGRYPYAVKFSRTPSRPTLQQVQASRFQFAINRALGIEVPPGLIANADKVIE